MILFLLMVIEGGQQLGESPTDPRILRAHAFRVGEHVRDDRPQLGQDRRVLAQHRTELIRGFRMTGERLLDQLDIFLEPEMPKQLVVQGEQTLRQFHGPGVGALDAGISSRQLNKLMNKFGLRKEEFK